MSLASIYLQLHSRAAATGTDRSYDLRGGARIAVRVQDGVTTLTISRVRKQLGAVEIETFRRDCGVPADAARYPAEGQGTKEREDLLWHFITYRWAEGAEN